jgi:hypothetical protein
MKNVNAICKFFVNILIPKSPISFPFFPFRALREFAHATIEDATGSE